MLLLTFKTFLTNRSPVDLKDFYIPVIQLAKRVLGLESLQSNTPEESYPYGCHGIGELCLHMSLFF